MTCANNDSLSFFPMPHALENKIELANNNKSRIYLKKRNFFVQKPQINKIFPTYVKNKKKKNHS